MVPWLLAIFTALFLGLLYHSLIAVQAKGGVEHKNHFLGMPWSFIYFGPVLGTVFVCHVITNQSWGEEGCQW
jgi:hypothetical protein